MRAELDDDLSRPRGMDQALRTVDDLVHRFRRGNAGQHHVALLADLGGRLCRHAAGLLEIGKRAAAIAEHAVPAFDQVFRDRQADLADADEANRLHSHSLDVFLLSLSELQRLIGQVHLHADRTFHHRPLAHLEAAELVDHERIRGCDLARLLFARRAQDGEPVACRRAGRHGQRTGREQRARLLQADHVFEMLRQDGADLLSGGGAFGEDHEELLSQHPLRELPDPLFCRRCHDARPTTSPAAMLRSARRPQSLCALSVMGNRPRRD